MFVHVHDKNSFTNSYRPACMPDRDYLKWLCIHHPDPSTVMEFVLNIGALAVHVYFPISSDDNINDH